MVKQMDREPTVPVCRFADTCFSELMAEYMVGCVLSHERKFDVMRDGQRQKRWVHDQVSGGRTLSELKIGILGVGNMGKQIARCFKVNSPAKSCPV